MALCFFSGIAGNDMGGIVWGVELKHFAGRGWWVQYEV